MDEFQAFTQNALDIKIILTHATNLKLQKIKNANFNIKPVIERNRTCFHVILKNLNQIKFTTITRWQQSHAGKKQIRQQK